ncbi:ATP-binding cassette domain-containing protein [Halococcus saccharolyticus]|uniref:ABC transporter n=1 Tax=Halococcus saccharolyticus DSM 5350 TaxID=1227455 RepID=M0MH40_9EURY|nr:ATP-binding cassette domain-containing protein [Halococcus saccharolyticus]EMA43755.1 ABC transporter [Halococcus saccharolyticus DSM 5350]
MLRTRGLTKQFGGLIAVDDVDFALGDELCSLIGPNGAGKTTFCDLLTGALEPTAGTIELAGDLDVLLLDEPNAGVSSESVDEIIALIDDVADDHAVLLVEHNMDVVMNVSDRVVVLHQGTIIADGDLETVRNDPAVQEAYLGGDEPDADNTGETNATDTEGSAA